MHPQTSQRLHSPQISCTPAFLRAHLVTSPGTLSNVFFYNSSESSIFSFTSIFPLHLPNCEDWISSSFPWHKSKLHSTDLYFLSENRNITYTVCTETANIPVLGLTSCDHSLISLLSASVFISTQLTPMYIHMTLT